MFSGHAHAGFDLICTGIPYGFENAMLWELESPLGTQNDEQREQLQKHLRCERCELFGGAPPTSARLNKRTSTGTGTVHTAVPYDRVRVLVRVLKIQLYQ